MPHEEGTAQAVPSSREGRTNPEMAAELFISPAQSNGTCTRCSASSASTRTGSSAGRVQISVRALSPTVEDTSRSKRPAGCTLRDELLAAVDVVRGAGQ